MPIRQLPCQIQGGFVQTTLSKVTRHSVAVRTRRSLRRVASDTDLAFAFHELHTSCNNWELTELSSAAELLQAIHFKSFTAIAYITGTSPSVMKVAMLNPPIWA
jgi:hypothetical protein